MNLFKIYRRAFELLLQEGRPVIFLALANAGIGLVQLAEPVLFGAIVDALTNQRPTLPYIAAWAGLGLFGILASVIVAVVADRMAHRRRLAVMADAFDTAITLPISYHAKAGTGATVRNILAGSDALWGTWLTFLRETVRSLRRRLPAHAACFLDGVAPRSSSAHAGDRLRGSQRARRAPHLGRPGPGRAAPHQGLRSGRRRHIQRRDRPRAMPGWRPKLLRCVMKCSNCCPPNIPC